MPRLILVHFKEERSVVAKDSDTLWSLLESEVKKNGWEGLAVRDSRGLLLEIHRPIGDFDFADGTRLFYEAPVNIKPALCRCPYAADQSQEWHVAGSPGCRNKIAEAKKGNGNG